MDQYAKEENSPIPGPSQPSRKHGSEGSGEPEGKVFKRKRLAKVCILLLFQGSMLTALERLAIHATKAKDAAMVPVSDSTFLTESP